MSSRNQKVFPFKNGFIFGLLLILLILIFCRVLPARAGSHPKLIETGIKAYDLLNPQPTPTPERPLELQTKSLPLPPFSPTDRGIDPSSLIVNLYDAEDLQDSVRTLRWYDPISFYKECWGENYPYQGCKLEDDLEDGANWSVKWEGKLIVPVDGVYTFNLPGHDDGVRVFIDGSEIIDSGWRYPDPDWFPSPQNAFMKKGLHDIAIDYEQRVPYVAELDVRWQGPGFSEEILPVAAIGKPTLSAVEFTQSIQEFQSLDELKEDLAVDGEPPVPIVSNKPAAARLYFNPVTSLTYVRVHFNIEGVVNRNTAMLLQPDCTVEKQRTEQDGCSGKNIYFTPPEGSWEAEIEIYDAEGKQIETHKLPFTSQDTKIVKMVPVTVCDRETANDDYECERGGQLPRYLPLLRSMIPSSKVSIVWDIRRVYVTDRIDIPGSLNVNWWLQLMVKLNNFWRADGSPDQYYFGMVRGEAPDTGPGGMAINRGAGAVVIDPHHFQGFTSKTVAHESGHLFQRYHPFNGKPDDKCDFPPFPWDLGWPYDDSYINEIGFDLSHNQPVGVQNVYEIMSYCRGDKWVSPHTYLGEMDYLSADPERMGLSVESGPVWQVSGYLDQNQLNISPIFLLESGRPTTGSSGSYSIQIVDGTGSILHIQQFDLYLGGQIDAEDDLSGYVFSELVPFIENATELIILDADQVQAASVPLSGQKPAVYPLPFDEAGPLQGNHELQWLVLDPDSENHTFRVEYLPGDGSAKVLGWGLVDPLLMIDFDELPACQENCQIRVTASDGSITGTGYLSGFQVPSKIPEVEIIFPEDNLTYQTGEMIWFQALAWDPDDGQLPDQQLIWQSSLDGFLGAGSQLPITNLSEGSHHITLIGKDQDGNSPQDAIQVFVDGTAPDLDLFVHRDAVPSQCVDVRIEALDPIGGSGLEQVQYSLNGGITWTAVPLDKLPYEFTVPETGEVHIMVRAFDSAGNLAADDVPSIEISGSCPGPNQPPTADAGGPYSAEEGQPVVLNASGSSDPDGDITLFQWDLDDDGEFDDGAGVQIEVVFGDNGVYPAVVQVTDQVGQQDIDQTQIEITNLNPDLELDLDTAEENSSGSFYLGRVEIPQTHQVFASDPGSDDLTFIWNNDSSSIYYNDNQQPDPPQSPEGTFPFRVTDQAEMIFLEPGLHLIQVDVSDDDGGTAAAELSKIITSDAVCTRSIGYWKHQFKENGKTVFSEDDLLAYLKGIEMLSGYFSESRELSSVDQAGEILTSNGKEALGKVEKQLLSTWLNFMNGSIAWDEPIEQLGDPPEAVPFGQFIDEIEQTILNPELSDQSLEEIKDLLESINLRDQESSQCD